MTKKEIIWRELLVQNRLHKINKFTQKGLAEKFGFSVSTVFNALKELRTRGIVKVSGNFFVLEDRVKLIYRWASERNLAKDIYKRFRVSGEVQELEGLAAPEVVFGLYSGFKFLFGYSPADYDHLYIYADENTLRKFLERISAAGKDIKENDVHSNLFILKPDDFLKSYGSLSEEQLFADIWNAPEWYSKDFIKELKNKLDL
jgi:DNA-binding Lrp family transcriptional regulator